MGLAGHKAVFTQQCMHLTRLWHAPVQGLGSKKANKEMKVKTYCYM